MTIKFAQRLFCGAGIYGIAVLTPMFFPEDVIGEYAPPSITHPGVFLRLRVHGVRLADRVPDDVARSAQTLQQTGTRTRLFEPHASSSVSRLLNVPRGAPRHHGKGHEKPRREVPRRSALPHAGLLSRLARMP
jgi:hypothetical protein